MSQGTAGAGERLVIAEEDEAIGRRSGILNALAPIIVGLVAPFLVFGLIEPAVLRHAKIMTIALLTPLFIGVIGIWMFTILNPGEVGAVVIDRAKGQLELVQVGLFATRTVPIAFSDVSGVRRVSTYDDDGYASVVGEIALKSGDLVHVPILANEAHLAEIRAAVAAGTSQSP